jgi:hypothetical protein
MKKSQRPLKKIRGLPKTVQKQLEQEKIREERCGPDDLERKARIQEKIALLHERSCLYNKGFVM